MSGQANRRNPSVYGRERAQSSDSRRNSHNGAHLLADWSERINRTVWIGRFLQVLQSCEERRSGRDRLSVFPPGSTSAPPSSRCRTRESLRRCREPNSKYKPRDSKSFSSTPPYFLCFQGAYPTLRGTPRSVLTSPKILRTIATS